VIVLDDGAIDGDDEDAIAEARHVAKDLAKRRPAGGFVIHDSDSANRTGKATLRSLNAHIGEPARRGKGVQPDIELRLLGARLNRGTDLRRQCAKPQLELAKQRLATFFQAAFFLQ